MCGDTLARGGSAHRERQAQVLKVPLVGLEEHDVLVKLGVQAAQVVYQRHLAKQLGQEKASKVGLGLVGGAGKGERGGGRGKGSRRAARQDRCGAQTTGSGHPAQPQRVHTW
jgi:hypothetical protein